MTDSASKRQHEIIASAGKLLMEKGARHVKYSEYPGVNHNSWDNAFAEPTFLSWMFNHKKKK